MKKMRRARRHRRRAVRHQPDDGHARRAHRDRRAAEGRRSRTALAEVLDLPRHIVEGSLDGLRLPGAKPPGAATHEHRSRRRRRPDALAARAPPPLGSSAAGRSRDRAIASRCSQGRKARTRRDRRAPRCRARRATLPDAAHEPARARRPPRRKTRRRRRALCAPAGSITPEGGYASVLPTTTTSPTTSIPDPVPEPRRSRSCPASSSASRSQRRSTSKLGDCVRSPRRRSASRSPAARITPPVAKQFRVIAHLRGRLRPVRLEARLHRSLRGAGLLRSGRHA